MPNKMSDKEIAYRITTHIARVSGLDQHREYLGISKISQCPRAAVLEFRNGITETGEAHRMCYAGYEQERAVMQLLYNAGVAINSFPMSKEVVAPFDSRLRGHIDGETVDGDLLEIKSVSRFKFDKIRKDHHAKFEHFVQVQLYMRYGGWKKSFIVYRCRETYEHVVVEVPYNEGQAEKFEQKARKMLAYIDEGSLPPCECGRCK